MASPVPQPAGPDPVAIRACLTPDVAAVFDAEWELVLEAKQSRNLVGIQELLGHWRHFACQELQEPGAYFGVLATAARAQATRKAPAGSLAGATGRLNRDPGSELADRGYL